MRIWLTGDCRLAKILQTTCDTRFLNGIPSRLATFVLNTSCDRQCLAIAALTAHTKQELASMLPPLLCYPSLAGMGYCHISPLCLTLSSFCRLPNVSSQLALNQPFAVVILFLILFLKDFKKECNNLI